jgi:GNAT superfamily N-acetyltransferase
MEANNEPLPEAGDYWIVIDGAGQPAAAIQSREVRIAPFRTVDAAFAWDEGEGDRSLAFWRGAHIDYFRKSCARQGIAWSKDLDVLFERFEVIWPRASAERLILRRPCTTDEWSAYHQLRAGLFAHYLPDLTYDPGHAENWTPDVDHLATFSAGDLLGCLQVRWLSPDEAAFQLVAVQENRRGQGLGRFLLSQAEIFADVNGRRLIRVFGEPEAAGFYRKLGFEDGPDWQETPLSAASIPLKKRL